MKVSQVMSKAVVIDPDITLKQAAKIMSKKNIANVIVIKDGKIKGYVSERDVLINLKNLDSQVSKIMSKSVISVSKDADINEAGKIMASKGLKRLPVVDSGKLVGAISFRDVIRHAHKSGVAEEGDFFFN
jgi:CBS domain-containing protein